MELTCQMTANSILLNVQRAQPEKNKIAAALHIYYLNGIFRFFDYVLRADRCKHLFPVPSQRLLKNIFLPDTRQFKTQQIDTFS